MAYFALIFNVENLDGNLYINAALNALVEVPPYLLMPFILSSKLGRVLSMSGALVVTGVTLLISIFLKTGIQPQEHL